MHWCPFVHTQLEDLISLVAVDGSFFEVKCVDQQLLDWDFMHLG
jgi:hypothetical protein